jgi:hypothetical protein
VYSFGDKTRRQTDINFIHVVQRTLTIYEQRHRLNDNNYYNNKNVSIEIQRIWNVKCFVIPVIIGATGILSKTLQKISGNNTRTTVNRFPTKNCHTRNITHHKESATS